MPFTRQSLSRRRRQQIRNLRLRDKTIEPKILVQKDERITNQSISDIVTSKLGSYSVTFDLMASNDNGQNQPIRQTLPVTVR